MFSRLNWAFTLYAMRHLEIALPPRRVRDDDGTLLGYVEDIRLRDGRLHLRGWCLGERITLDLGDTSISRVPSVERADVADAMGCDPRVGFEASLPFAPEPLHVTMHRDPARARISVPMPGPGRVGRARCRLFARFLWDLMRGAPFLLGGCRAGEMELRRRVKTVLRLDAAPGTHELDAAVLGPADPVPVPQDTITIVVPVHNAFDLLAETLTRVVAHTDLPWRLVLIEDCSTDERVRPFLRDWVAAARRDTGAGIELIENAENLGFIGSVNRGFETAAAFGDPVVLLNSDALVPAGWATRLLAPLAADARVASVTPMSNDAEIFTAPVICAAAPLAPGQADRIDRRAARLAPRARPAEAPTGVGFCMAMNPAFLQNIPAFDTAFGRGYGEEVDWCRKTAALGGRHVAATNLFVEHRGGESFGSTEKRALVRANNRIISERYPDYDGLVQQFIMSDPLITERLALALAWLDSHSDLSEVPVFVAHSLGGGAETWLQHRIGQMAPRAAVVLRFGGALRCRIEAITPAGITAAATDDLATVRRLVLGLDRRRIVYSCAVGDTDIAGLPGFLAGLVRDRALDVLFHDFLPISPSYTLLDSDMVFRGVPDPATADSAHQIRRQDGTRMGLRDWQTAWHGLLSKAERLVTFSEDSRTHVATAYPDLAGRIEATPHRLVSDIPALAPDAAGTGSVIGVLGNIGPQKGIGVLAALSQRVAETPDMSLVVIGRVDPRTPLHPSATVHGPYAPADIPDLVRRYGITCWLIPSIWPETFSYTTHECLATGLPVITFDLGAQGAAAARAENGIVIALPPEGATAAPVIAAIMDSARRGAQRPAPGDLEAPDRAI